MHRTFCILEAADVVDFDFSEVLESENSLRWSVDGSQTFVKFDGATTPEALEGKTLNTYNEIKTILATSDWTDPN